MGLVIGEVMWVDSFREGVICGLSMLQLSSIIFELEGVTAGS